MSANSKRKCNPEFCPVEMTLDLISGKYKLLIIYHLFEGKKRFNELQRLMYNLSHRTLTLQLRDLEQSKLITRKVYPQVPPKVEYELTELGTSLKPITEAMRVWGLEYKAKNG